MKYAISLLFCFNAWASPIQVFFEKDADEAQMMKEIFMEDYKIPEGLIDLIQVRSCEALKERGKLDLCLKSNGDLLVVSVDHEFVSESLTIFRAP
jgi:hypothetical protein